AFRIIDCLRRRIIGQGRFAQVVIGIRDIRKSRPFRRGKIKADGIDRHAVKRHKNAIRPSIVEGRHFPLAMRWTIHVVVSIEPINNKKNGFLTKILVPQEIGECGITCRTIGIVTETVDFSPALYPAVTGPGRHNLGQLWMRDAELPANDRHGAPDRGVLEGIAKSVSTDHSGRADNYKAFLARRRDVHRRPRGASTVNTGAVMPPDVMKVRAPPTSRRIAYAPQTPMRRPSSRKCRDIGARRASNVAFRLLE